MYKLLFMCYLYISSWIEVRGQIKNHDLFSNFHPIFFTSQLFQPFSPPLRRHNLQLERAKIFFLKYTIPLSEFAMPAGIRQHGSFVALVKVSQSSRHCLKEFKDNSGGFDSRERKLLIGQDQMKEGVAIELSQPRLFAPGH